MDYEELQIEQEQRHIDYFIDQQDRLAEYEADDE